MEVILNDEPIYGVNLVTKTGTMLVYEDLVKDKTISKVIVENDDEGNWYIVNFDDDGQRISTTFVKENSVREWSIYHVKTDHIVNYVREIREDAEKQGVHLSA